MEWQITIDGKVYDGIIGDRNYDSTNIIADNEPIADSLNKIANYLNTEDFVEKRYYPAWQDFTVVGTATPSQLIRGICFVNGYFE